eukprot:GHVQ01024501.1.p1 GENE.GHVQ01024501.1~~GHVQ01024501.1.p1  ORF type:complete len:147 (-),score=18.12 GHVQ01024501.1:305-745(-)
MASTQTHINRYTSETRSGYFKTQQKSVHSTLDLPSSYDKDSPLGSTVASRIPTSPAFQRQYSPSTVAPSLSSDSCPSEPPSASSPVHADATYHTGISPASSHESSPGSSTKIQQSAGLSHPGRHSGKPDALDSPVWTCLFQQGPGC